MIDMNVLRDLTNAFGPSGFEEDVVRAVRKHCTGMSLTNDAMNNVYARIGGNAEGRKPVLMLDAHTDECGFMVQGIMENGLLSLIMLGGMDLPSIPAHTLLVRTRAGSPILIPKLSIASFFCMHLHLRTFHGYLMGRFFLYLS